MKRALPALFVASLLAATSSKAAPVSPPHGASGGATCGDYKCEPPEDCKSCPQDCGSCCGNHKCEAPEDCNSCPQDCGRCCGNYKCEPPEDCKSCPQDCGSCK